MLTFWKFTFNQKPPACVHQLKVGNSFVYQNTQNFLCFLYCVHIEWVNVNSKHAYFQYVGMHLCKQYQHVVGSKYAGDILTTLWRLHNSVCQPVFKQACECSYWLLSLSLKNHYIILWLVNKHGQSSLAYNNVW